MYAPPEVQTILNNAYTNGYRNTPQSGKIFDSTQRMTNGMSQMVLGVNGFHAMMTAVQGTISQMALGMEKLASGDMSGLKDVVTSPAAPIANVLPE